MGISLGETVKRITLEEQEIKQSRLMRNLSRISKLRKICEEEKPNILVSFMEEPNFRAILATRGLPVKTLISVRNDPNKEYAGRLGTFVGKALLPMADGCVFQTREAQAWFPEKLQKKSKIIYNAVKEDFYHIERKPNHEEIVTCGRLTEQKNHAMLIAAFAEVAKQRPNATLRIYGEGFCGMFCRSKSIPWDFKARHFSWEQRIMWEKLGNCRPFCTFIGL